jgi:hypothetical protein
MDKAGGQAPAMGASRIGKRMPARSLKECTRRARSLFMEGIPSVVSFQLSTFGSQLKVLAKKKFTEN